MSKHENKLSKRTRDSLVQNNTALVHFLAHKAGFHENDGAYDDAISEGLLGLWEAARTWDPARGVEFGTFAWHYIRAGLTRARRALAKYGGGRTQIDWPSHRDGSTRVEIDAVALRATDPAFDRAPDMTSEQQIGTLLQLVGQPGLLSDAERRVIELRYLAQLESDDEPGDDEPDSCPTIVSEAPGRTFAAIGKRLGVSGAYCQRLEKNALAKLRSAMNPSAATAA